MRPRSHHSHLLHSIQTVSVIPEGPGNIFFSGGGEAARLVKCNGGVAEADPPAPVPDWSTGRRPHTINFVKSYMFVVLYNVDPMLSHYSAEAVGVGSCESSPMDTTGCLSR